MKAPKYIQIKDYEERSGMVNVTEIRNLFKHMNPFYGCFGLINYNFAKLINNTDQS